MTSSAITFEDGYGRLQGIAERLNSDEVPVHEMCDLLAEGTGLHQALSSYLGEQKERVEAIERGEGVQAFRIVPPEARTAEAPREHGTGEPSELFGPGAPTRSGAAPAGLDDDIPF